MRSEGFYVNEKSIDSSWDRTSDTSDLWHSTPLARSITVKQRGDMTKIKQVSRAGRKESPVTDGASSRYNSRFIYVAVSAHILCNTFIIFGGRCVMYFY